MRLYDRLFVDENPAEAGKEKSLSELLNPDSLRIVTHARVEPFLAEAKQDEYYQFQRVGYFCLDPDSRPDHLVFNRTVSLKDTWKKVNK